MKAVLISIQPKWCEKIASGDKTVEIRKNRPKMEPPFKCYIYCTSVKNMNFLSYAQLHTSTHGLVDSWSQKVIGEFICDEIITVGVKYSDPSNRLSLREFPFTCLTDRQVMDYLGNGVDGYGWHISELIVYEKPKAISEFSQCHKCEYMGVCHGKCWKPMERAPQSWCYVEEIG